MRVLDQLRKVKRRYLALRGLDVRYTPQIEHPYEELGALAGVWCVNTAALARGGIAYSFGIGTDISFEEDLMNSTQVELHAFDPTPRSLAWLRSRPLPSRISIHDYGISDSDGTARFFAPANVAHVSFSMRHHALPTDAGTVCSVYRLATIMEKLGHAKLDLLKMDIEGAEYAVLQDVVRSGLSIPQILVEFHHRWSRSDVALTDQTIRMLNEHGYRIYHVSPTGMEYSFVQSSPEAANE